MKRRNRYDKSVYRSLAMFMQFGLHMLVPVCMMSALGVYLDRRLGTSWIMILLFFVGAAAGAQNVYRLAKQLGGKPEDRHKKTRQHGTQDAERTTPRGEHSARGAEEQAPRGDGRGERGNGKSPGGMPQTDKSARETDKERQK